MFGLETMKTGGYCYGDRIYIRDNIRRLVDEELFVANASDIGLDVGKSAVVILYKGNNITNALIQELIDNKMVKKNAENKIIFIPREIDNTYWTLDDFYPEGESSMKLCQDICELDRIIKNSLERCESFRGNVEDVYVVEDAYGRYWQSSDDRYFCIFYENPKYNKNITRSLMNKLCDLSLLYNDYGRYILITDKKATVGLDYRISKAFRDIIFYFIPLILGVGIIGLVFNKIIAFIGLAVGCVYYGYRRHIVNVSKSTSDKLDIMESKILYWVKQGLLIWIATVISILIIGLKGFFVLVVFGGISLYRYKKIYKHVK